MTGRNNNDTLPIVELLGVEAAMLTDSKQSAVAPVVFIAVRPQPHHSWQSFSFPLSLEHATRLRDDLTSLLQQFQPPPQLN